MSTRDSQTTTAKATMSAATTMTCDDHEYDEYCPEQYDAHHHHHHGSAQSQAAQQQCERERERERDRERDRERERERERERDRERDRERERERERDGHHRHSSSRAAASALKHQRAATFDVADARDYELQRLGNRRSQQQQQLQQQLQQAASGIGSAGGGGSSKLRSGGEHRGERTHDRERSRSDHRISTYACDDTALCGNSTGGHQHHLANGGLTQSSRQQRREKTFKV